MNVNRSTILTLTRLLQTANLVRERQQPGEGRSGRPSLLVSPAADRAWVLAFDVAVDRLTAAICTGAPRPAPSAWASARRTAA
ncbi:hypothetical protein Cs7R123_56770 [Catellatospora sp. TT07R-123]|nr:hypothetical protein Cs7R123_56770 [Catellatospora sp. TT07R-123]